MTLEVRVEAEASADLVAAIEYYLREAGSELTSRFVETAEVAFNLVARPMWKKQDLRERLAECDRPKTERRAGARPEK